ncbi:MAG: alkaline phosphatase family protein [Thermoanaerobaculaceae bacterium]|nr:alkaline phosphatase family protein [Thermoanaerobaculaceae bacterium]
MKKINFFLFLLILFCFSFSSPKISNSNILILLSFDGIRWDAIENVKGFSKVEEEGFKVLKMRSVFPSLTFPAHSSIATGTFPRKNGIVSSVFLEKNSGRRFSEEKEAEWLLTPPLWVIAEKNGLKSAVCAWPISQGSWKGTSPSLYKPFTEELKDKDIEEWVIDLIKSKDKPNLIMAWFHGGDFVGHKFGPKSNEYKEAVIRSGEIIERIIFAIQNAGLANKATLLITSDHGMAEVKNEIDLVSKIPKKSFYPFIAISGPVANIYVENPNQYYAVKNSLKPFKKNFLIFGKAEIPFEYSTGDSSRSGDFLALCNIGDVFEPFKGKRKDEMKCMHGYPPSNLDMCGIFLAYGKGLPKKKIEEATIVDICPTALKLMGVNYLGDIDGKPLF